MRMQPVRGEQVQEAIPPEPTARFYRRAFKRKVPAAMTAPTDGSVGALQGRTLAGGPTPRLQLVTSQATSAEAFSEISDYSSDGAQTELSLHSQPLPQSLSSLHAVAEHVALTAPPRRALRMRKAILSVRA